DASTISRLIVVDTKSPGRLGALAEVLEQKGVEVHIYDHHAHGSGDIHGAEEVIEQVGATATIFSEILKAKRKEPSAIEATLLMLGIYEETGHLLYPTTTERDIKAAAYLLKCGANLNIVARYMKDELGPAEVRLLNECMATASEEAIGGLRVLTATASSEHYVGDAAHLCHRLLDMTHADAAIMMLRLEGKILVVGRSRTPQINMAEALEPLGGGGHPTAASATVEDSPLELLREKVVRSLQGTIRPGKFAEHVMTSPVITIGHESSVEEAEEKMTRFEVNVLPVLRDKDYLGLISREDVEKASHHGYGSRPVKDFANTDAGTAKRYTPVREVERQMVERNQRFMPVVKEGSVIGAITRTDLLRSLYDDYLRRTGVKEDGGRTQGTIVKNVGPWIRNRFPEDAASLLRLAGETADSMGYDAYLVGGTVRDLLRGEENLDMDIVVEGDGIAFARQMAERIGAKVHPHERFKTAKIVTDSLRMDIATARTEHYESPASLPSITASSIKRDLYRRDFTINTLAMRLNQTRFGQVVDFFGGQRDIKEKSIRV
ncbi:MAG: CBS domain-containing protein, partial [Thermodesulfovibrionales bacterium]|nr:CBS domain-containing protein [Thermodesulfovibrionales bacterium]